MGTEVSEGSTTLIQRTSTLDEVVEDEAAVALRVSLLNDDLSLISVSDLAAGDELEVAGHVEVLELCLDTGLVEGEEVGVLALELGEGQLRALSDELVCEERLESLGGAVVREDDTLDELAEGWLGVSLEVFLVEAEEEDAEVDEEDLLQEERDGGLHGGDDSSVEVEAILETVEVVYHEASAVITTEREGGEKLGVGVGGGDLALLDDSLHGSDWEVREDDGETLDEGLEQSDEDGELRERDVVVVEGGDEEDVHSGDVVHLLGEAADTDVVGAVRKLRPLGLEVDEPGGVGGDDLLSEVLHLWGGEDDVSLLLARADDEVFPFLRDFSDSLLWGEVFFLKAF